ncbi:hypothetical protein [Luteibacter sp. UNC138MFCol5.1]|uniref:hypothetical protein n=1 Tax=Luteibacter sp. UNC138MFCol5.1 TaxID=1502774 RepID=UPI0015A50EE0|nr:hypothetical protein [Luteibacter sp. UNC138MFCol5.1]
MLETIELTAAAEGGFIGTRMQTGEASSPVRLDQEVAADFASVLQPSPLGPLRHPSAKHGQPDPSYSLNAWTLSTLSMIPFGEATFSARFPRRIPKDFRHL